MSQRPPTFWELAIQASTSTRHGYNLLAPRFEQTGYATPSFLIEACRRRVDRLFPPSPSAGRGADLACGTGRAIAAMRGDGLRWDGYDFSPGMLRQARMRLGEAGASLIDADLATLDLPAATYRRVVTFGAWGHILPLWRRRLITQIVATLTEDGVFYTITADAPSRWRWEGLASLLFDLSIRVRNRLLAEPFHMYYRLNDTATVRRLFQEVGGVEVRLEPVPGSPHPRLTLLMVSRSPAARTPEEPRRDRRSRLGRPAPERP